MIKTRPRRPLDARGPAIDAPLPLLVTCAGMALPWPSGNALRDVEADYSDLAADAQEGANVPPAAWNRLATRHAAARPV